MINGLEEIIEAVKESEKKETTPLIFVPKVEELNDEIKANDEYDLLGYFISFNPLEKYRTKLLDLTPTSNLTEKDEGSTVVMGGIITNLKKIMTKAKKEMAFFDLEDLQGRVEVVAFSHLYAKNIDMFEKNKPVEIVGKLEVQSREVNGEEVTTPKLILMKISDLEEGKQLEKIVVCPRERDDFDKIKDIITSNPGKIPVEIEFENAVLKTKYTILSDKNVLAELESSCHTRRIYGN